MKLPLTQEAFFFSIATYFMITKTLLRTLIITDSKVLESNDSSFIQTFLLGSTSFDIETRKNNF